MKLGNASLEIVRSLIAIWFSRLCLRSLRDLKLIGLLAVSSSNLEEGYTMNSIQGICRFRKKIKINQLTDFGDEMENQSITSLKFTRDQTITIAYVQKTFIIIDFEYNLRKRLECLPNIVALGQNHGLLCTRTSSVNEPYSQQT